jgi:hypothetical protein
MFGKNLVLANAAVFGYSSCRGRRDFGIFGGFERQFSQFRLDTSGMPNFVAVGHFNT